MNRARARLAASTFLPHASRSRRMATGAGVQHRGPAGRAPTGLGAPPRALLARRTSLTKRARRARACSLAKTAHITRFLPLSCRLRPGRVFPRLGSPVLLGLHVGDLSRCVVLPLPQPMSAEGG